MIGKRVTNSWWHRWRIRVNGRVDGKRGIPALDTMQISPYEAGLLETGQYHLEQIRQKFSDELETREGAFNATVQKLNDLVSKFESEFQRYSDKKTELGRDVIVHFSRFWYLIVLYCIAVGELALNFQAFQVFQKPLLMTFTMAMAIAIGLPVSAHFIGIFLKQWPKPFRKTAVLLALFVLIAGLCLFGINTARSEYLRLLDADLEASEAVLHRAFLMINLFVFAVAVKMSYFAHDSDPDFEDADKTVRDLDRQIRKTGDRIPRLAGEIDSLLVRQQSEERLLQATIRELIYLYRGENQRVRANAELPKVFENEPKVPEHGKIRQTQEPREMKDVRSILDRWSNIRRPSKQPNPETDEDCKA